MQFGLIGLNDEFLQNYCKNEILESNKLTEQYGLTLNEAQAIELSKTHSSALKQNGRIEFGGGVVQKIIKEFCDSPYITKYNYADVLNELTDMFYYYKNETLDLISDDELICFMAKSFNGSCQGSCELLASRELFDLAHNLRFYNKTENPFENNVTQTNGESYDE